LRKISSKKKKKTPKNSGSLLSPIFKSKFSSQDKTFYCEVFNETLTEDQSRKSNDKENAPKASASTHFDTTKMSNNTANASYVNIITLIILF
jgi:hypothetical protein